MYFFSQDAGALGAVSGEAKTYPLPEEVLESSVRQSIALRTALGLAFLVVLGF